MARVNGEIDLRLAADLEETRARRGRDTDVLMSLEDDLRALARLFAEQLDNRPESAPWPPLAVPGDMWVEWAIQAGLHHAARADVDGVAWPTDELTAEEAGQHTHGGLFFVDIRDTDGNPVRLFLPNFFNAFQHWLASTARYSELLGARGAVLARLGRTAEAEACLREAEAFAPSPR